MNDKAGREYLKLADAKQGMRVELDDGFDCNPWREGDGKTLLLCDADGIYFRCANGHHYISGQCDDGIHCVGIYP